MNPTQHVKKFGTFAGVFTPSLLTILGVIMYMRLGWVVGHAGLYGTIFIILLAHVISFTTGLSVSSIATDKKIKAGGIYYVLSRSLGLPIGGAIGIALVIGTALSISLYLIGFAESFLSVDYIREFTGIEPSINSYRVIGTLAILLLVIIAYISTSFALKTQFYILGTIVLSLLSIAIGISTQVEYQTDAILSFPAEENLSFELLFAVFFPAVTGFTAGIAMSGDLKDPGKAIPRGTLGAILVGFLVYVGLAIGFSVYVDRDLLLTDTNFLLKVSWIAPLVIAGIWGATLSSALGGILGGPRITQAIANDKIGPRIFAKGYGLNNEPRTALLFVFLVAEAGILIGDLNVIARVVTMFYLASYGFINLAFYLESVASVDFRPTFRVNKYIGLVGFLAAFGMMFKLDFLAMIVALILMASLYFILKRRQLKLDYVDVWRSVWLSITRIALTKMESSKVADHTWLPNIMLFSGGTEQRPHLIELGKMLVGKQGVLSNFDLIEHPDAKELFPKIQYDHPQPFAESGMFARRQVVNNTYAGIEMIAQTYGFSGVEPNSVMLGWANQTKNPTGFAKLLHTFNELDLNTIVVRYDRRSGFGAFKTIDCWIFDQSTNSNFILILTKLLLISDRFSDARPRVLFINDQNEKQAEIVESIEHLLDSIRLNATVKVINNQLERKPYETIVQEMSQKSDIVMMELPEVNNQSAHEFIEVNNQLLEKIGTVIMLKASKTFSKIEVKKKAGKTSYPIPKLVSQDMPEDQICPDYPENLLIAGQMEIAWKSTRDEIDDIWKSTLAPLLHFREDKVKSTTQLLLKTQQTLVSKLPELKAARKLVFLHQLKSNVLVRMGSMLEEQRILLEKEQLDYLQPLIQQLNRMGDKVAASLVEDLIVSIPVHCLTNNRQAGFGMKIFRLKKILQHRYLAKNKPLDYHIRLRKIANIFINNKIDEAIRAVLSAFSMAQLQLVYEYRRLIFATNEAFLFLENHAKKELSKEQIEGFGQSIAQPLEEIMQQAKLHIKTVQETMYKEFCTIISELGSAASGLHPNRHTNAAVRKDLKKQQIQRQTWPEKWQWQQNILLQTMNTEVQLMLIQARLSKLMKDSMEEMSIELVQPLLSQIGQVDGYFSDLQTSTSNSVATSANSLLKIFKYQEDSSAEKMNRIFEKTLRNAKSIQKIAPDKVKVFTERSLNSLTVSQLEYIESQELNLSLLLDASVQSFLIEPFYASANNLVKKLFETSLKVNDAIRLAALNLQSRIDTEDASDQIETMLAEQHQIIQHQRLEIENDVASFNALMKDKLNESQLAFSIHGLLKPVDKTGRYQQIEKKWAFVGQAKKFQNKISYFLKKIQAKYWHGQSDAKLMSERLGKSQPSHYSPLSEMIQLKEQHTPKRDILNRLPFYYQQLFAGKLNEQSSLWVGRELELHLAKKAIQRYKSGHKGLVVVSGDYRSGKTFFVNHLISRFLVNRKVVSIKSITGGSINKEVLLQAFNQAMGLNGSLSEILAAMPHQAVVVIDELELWWERTPQGLHFIQELVGLLGEIANKVPVIVSCQKLTYKLIAQQTDIDSITIQHIELFPMNSRDLQKAIMLRHRTSGYGLQIDSTLPVRISINREARLFSRLFKQSGGNPGSALLMWMAAIVGVADKTIVVQTPKSPDLSPLQFVDPELKQLLLQFLLHRQMDMPKLLRVCLDEVQVVNDQLQLLLRAGLLKIISGNVYEIDPYMLHHFNTLIIDELLNPTDNIPLR